MNPRLTIPKESKFIADPKMRELNETLMRQQEHVKSAFDGAQLAATRRLAPQAAITQSGFLARPGMFLPVNEATTILLAKPTPNDAGQPLAIYNNSGGVVVLEPAGTTINGKALGWIDAGLHVLYPDASGWFGGFSRSVEIGEISALAGTTTGVLAAVAPDIPSLSAGPMLIAVLAEQGIVTPTAPSFGPAGVGVANGSMVGANSATTVAIFAFAIAALTAASKASAPSSNLAAFADMTTDLLAFALWVTGADQARGFGTAVQTDSATTSITSGDITTTRPGALILDFMANDDETDTGTPGTGQTEIVDGSAGSATVSLQASYKPMPRPGTTTMSWSALTNAANKAHVAIVIEPARAA